MGDSMGCSTEHCWSVLWVHPMEALDGGIQRSINFMENSKEHSMEDSNEHLMEHCLEQTFDGTSDGKSDGTFHGTFDGTSDAHSTEYSTEHLMEHSMERSMEQRTFGGTLDGANYRRNIRSIRARQAYDADIIDSCDDTTTSPQQYVYRHYRHAYRHP